MLRNLIPILLVAAGCSGTPENNPAEETPFAWDDSSRAEAIATGTAVLAAHQCNRCHVIDELPKAARQDDCVSCHVFIDGLQPQSDLYARIAAKTGEDTLIRYQHNIEHLKRVPNLTAVAKRIQPAALQAYVQDPYDLRPALSASMIRTNLSPQEAESIARYFAAVADVPPRHTPSQTPAKPSPDALAAGEVLFKSKACGTCHTFGNRPTGMTAQMLTANPAAALAPNLRFVQDRMNWDTTVAWIVDPKSVWAPAKMPAMGVTPQEAEVLATYLFYADPELLPTPVPSPMTLPPAHEDPVSWAQVKEETLGKVCVHCHMNDFEKDPGPGNQGGLGYTGNGLKMRTYEALISGYEHGTRNALQSASDQEIAPILTAMLLRRRENQRDRIAPFQDYERPAYPAGPTANLHLSRGMPMGLPAMTDSEIAVLAAWIDQGCIGPTEITGKPGSDDGFLVPDGPILVNKGCGIRPISPERPSWAVDQGAP